MNREYDANYDENVNEVYDGEPDEEYDEEFDVESEEDSSESNLISRLRNRLQGAGNKGKANELAVADKKIPVIMSDEDFEINNKLDREEAIRHLRFRKKMLRRFAAFFFAALIILTFFSNTIMNYSLPEVSTVTVFSGNVSQKVRCQGPVEVSDDVEITVSGTRTVSEVLVEDGDQVKEGDVIMTFDENENTDLKEAEKTLEELETAYEKSQLRTTTDYTDDEVAIQNAKDELSDAEADLEQAKQDAADLVVAQQQESEAQAAYDEKYIEVEGLQTQVDSYKEMENYDGVDVEALVTQLTDAKTELASLEITLNEKKDAVTTLSGKTTVEAAEDLVKTKSQSVSSLQRSLKSKKESAYITSETNAIDDADALKKIDEQKAKVEKLKASDDSKEVKAAGSGIITGITVKKGDKVNADTVVAKIQLADSGYVVTCNISKRDGQLLRVGNEASIENVWGEDVSATIRSIKADPADPNQKSIAKFSVLGNVQVGETLQFAVGDKSNKYDTVVPNGAVKEDSDGKYVYVVKAKPTPLGNRYIVKKVKVDVLASDTMNTAIAGEVTEYDNVITNASKPLDNGQQVRLNENQ